MWKHGSTLLPGKGGGQQCQKGTEENTQVVIFYHDSKNPLGRLLGNEKVLPYVYYRGVYSGTYPPPPGRGDFCKCHVRGKHNREEKQRGTVKEKE
jgi:hypothetical protein